VFRTGASRRTAAVLVSAAFKDAELISPSDKTLVVDKTKITREMKKLEKKKSKEKETKRSRLFEDFTLTEERTTQWSGKGKESDFIGKTSKKSMCAKLASQVRLF